MSEQCWAQAELEFQKQFGNLLHVATWLMLAHCCEQTPVALLHTHVTSPVQALCVERVAHVTAHPPVAVTLQSGREAHEDPTYGHCVKHEACATDHEQVDAVWQSTLLSDEHSAWQMLLTASHVHTPSDALQALTVENCCWQVPLQM